MKPLFRIVALVVLCLSFYLSCTKKNNEFPKPGSIKTTDPKDSVLTQAEVSALQTAFANNKINGFEAEKIAMEFISSAGAIATNKRLSEESLRSLSSKKVVWLSTGSFAQSGQLRQETDSIPLFVYNFQTPLDNTAGYAIVCGDRRLPQVLACTFDGTIADTSAETGAKDLLVNIPTFIDLELKRRKEEMMANLPSAMEKIKNHLPDSIKQKLGNNIPINTNARMQGYLHWELQVINWGPWQIVGSVGPLIQTKWNQNDPYNAQVPLMCGYNRAPTGCQATAMAQIMAYWRYPNNFYTIPFNWTYILEKRTYDISTLFYTIGQLSAMSYGCSGSSTSNENILNAYLATGYKIKPYPQIPTLRILDYSLDIIKSSLNSRMPVHTTGTNLALTSAHAWLIDGWQLKQQAWVGYMTLYNYNTPMGGYFTSGTIQNEYVQCNFGWGGDSDGLYISGLFNPPSTTLVFQTQLCLFR